MNKLLLPLLTLIFLVSCKKETEEPPAAEVEQLNPDDFIGTIWELQEFYYNDSALRIGLHHYPSGNMIVSKAYFKFFADNKMQKIETIEADELENWNGNASIVDISFNINEILNSAGIDPANIIIANTKYTYSWQIINNKILVKRGFYILDLNKEVELSSFTILMRPNKEMYVEIPIDEKRIAVLSLVDIKRSGMFRQFFKQVDEVSGVLLMSSYREEL
ncbi:hypothetical protein [Gynurincola endophyticus]|uniref:hypothetical protein n=1 Tax=Gynurincola endophyticus TaxID=2479004 RepID=UPI000F8F1E96|nr:hypothetical protein [Gynurincola endophyticus]